MEQPETKEQAGISPTAEEAGQLHPAVAYSQGASTVSPQACASCGTPSNSPALAPGARSYVYALGTIETRFPRVSVEKEFAQATGRADTKGLTDRQALHSILSKPENRYLIRQMCWVMTIEGLETYILVPRDQADLSLLVGALRPTPTASDLDVVIGMKGPIAPAEVCNGLMVPIVLFDQIYSFDRDSLIASIPQAKKTPAKEFAAAAEELLDRILQMTDNAGYLDDHRALNYLSVRYPAIYATTAEAFERNSSLAAVDVRPSALSGTRRVLDVIFSYVNRNTDVTEKFFVRVDVTEEFPFLVTKMSPYYDRG
jgi:hypothetical protein